MRRCRFPALARTYYQRVPERTDAAGQMKALVADGKEAWDVDPDQDRSLPRGSARGGRSYSR
jgi:hypothetical protein